MKRLLVALSLLVLLPVMAWADFYGSAKADKYHLKECRWAKRIAKENLVTFKTSADAVKAGYQPCETCKPPVPEKRPASPVKGAGQKKVADGP